MIGGILCSVVAFVIVGPKAFGNILKGTHNYSDGFSKKFAVDSEKYLKEQYEQAQK